MEPGEVVTISPEYGIQSYKNMCQEQHARCIFEYIYFARLDSVIDGMSVYDSRITAGRCLAKDSPVDADVVVGVPESGNAHHDADGFITLFGLPLKVRAMKLLELENKKNN